MVGQSDGAIEGLAVMLRLAVVTSAVGGGPRPPSRRQGDFFPAQEGEVGCRSRQTSGLAHCAAAEQNTKAALGPRYGILNGDCKLLSSSMREGLFLGSLLGDSEFDSFPVGLGCSPSKFLNVIPNPFSSGCFSEGSGFPGLGLIQHL